MSRYKITFTDLKRISEALAKGYDDVLIDFLNEFRGKDTFEKFKNILKCWEHDVSYTLNFNVCDTPTKIQLSYINSQFQTLSDDITIKDEDLELVIGIPTEFELSYSIPVYNVVKYIDISGISIDLTALSFRDKQAIIDKLPAAVYNTIIKNIEKVTDRTFSVDNALLKDFKINFLSSDTYHFLKGLFLTFDDYYFKDVIFYLSKRVSGELLLQSTPLEIEYYVEKLGEDKDPDNSINI